MKFLPELEEVKRIKAEGKYDIVPVSLEMLSDVRTPIETVRILKSVSRHCYMLESVAENEKWGRYTFLGFDPKMSVTCSEGKMNIGGVTIETNDPNKYLRQILNENKSPRFSYLPPFTGGLVGYFAFDYINYSEPKSKVDVNDTEEFKDIDLMLFDKVIAFDNYRQKIILIAGGKDKGISYDAIGPAICEHVKKLYLTGMTAGVIKAAVEKAPEYKPGYPEIYVIDGFADTIRAAAAAAEEGDVVLLSPASTSFDRFKNFEERGNAFRRVVEELK